MNKALNIDVRYVLWVDDNVMIDVLSSFLYEYNSY